MSGAPRQGNRNVGRKSQITGQPPTKRLRKRRKKNTNRGRFPNPRPLMYIITAKGTGKKMHYDGMKFSERAKVKLFATSDAAAKFAYGLVSRFPVLKKYRVAVESNLPHAAGHPPGK